MDELSQLSRRERQIMEIIYAKGEATATDVLAALADPPTRTAVRTFLSILEKKGHLTHEKRGREFLFRPSRAPERTGQSAFGRVLETFFGGSLEKAVASYLADPKSDVSPETLRRLSALINQSKRKDL
ncbi:MAG: BlaI/MecI/CopY family transcriptional regulator [Verrucomicrobia bacterium]|nr:BlaI/MecI/CopY family transcriptional regulator [Verrucomicrobiota bacterium]